MYQIKIISNGKIIFKTRIFISFIELVNNSKIDFDYIDKFGYEILLFKDGKLLNILS